MGRRIAGARGPVGRFAGCPIGPVGPVGPVGRFADQRFDSSRTGYGITLNSIMVLP